MDTWYVANSAELRPPWPASYCNLCRMTDWPMHFLGGAFQL